MRPAALLLLLLALAACTQARESPEDQLRAFLAQAEKAVEERDAGALKALIADDYRDEEGRDKRALVGYATYQMLREGSLHLSTRLLAAEFPEPRRANAVVLAAMARTRIELFSLPDVDADVYRFTLALRRDDDQWQVARAEWRPATVEDVAGD